jgi:hypothetical protein
MGDRACPDHSHSTPAGLGSPPSGRDSAAVILYSGSQLVISLLVGAI